MQIQAAIPRLDHSLPIAAAAVGPLHWWIAALQAVVEYNVAFPDAAIGAARSYSPQAHQVMLGTAARTTADTVCNKKCR